MAKTLVIVESPAKARTIRQFLGKDYQVEASFGHVRDLPEKAADIPKEYKGKKWSNLGVNVEADFEPIYVVSNDKKKYVKQLKDAMKGVDHLMLATDEDREGESISWHILELLKPKKRMKIERIVFHEITREAIEEAIAHPRQVDLSLVKAQETRRVLDRLYGYTLSPLLWKKVGPKLSAGRVQSVAVRLVVMREKERKAFSDATYASIQAELKSAKGNFTARLQKISDSSIAIGASFDDTGTLKNDKDTWLKLDSAQKKAESLLTAKPWEATKVESKPGTENPPVPFMTSSLQQEANRKLGFPARKTMQIAQQLYEGINIGSGSVGLITYMRTDSLNLAQKAVNEIRDHISSNFGKEYLPSKQPVFKKKSKNAQEAHEAIRPTDVSLKPNDIKSHLNTDQFKLYDLIWKRTVACQMAKAEVLRTRIEITVEEDGNPHLFGASGKSITFPGFLRVYVEGSDDPEAELSDKETILPEIKQGEDVTAQKVTAEEHTTKPPARYTEATLVRALESEGIGRPSTYASIIGTIQDRGYVYKSANQLVPTFTAFAVTSLLEENFTRLVDTTFTAQMEDELDDIAEGKLDPVDHLKAFYFGSKEDLGIVEKVEKRGPDIPFPRIELSDEVIIRIGRNGPFIQRGEGGTGNTASIPDGIAPADLTLEVALEILDAKQKGPTEVGKDSSTGKSVFLKSGRYGDYMEVEQTEEEINSKNKPKRVTLPPDLPADSIEQSDIDILLAYPKTVGKHPDSGADIVLSLGRYGPYLVAGDQNANVGDWKRAINLSIEECVKALSEGGAKRKSSKPSALKEFGELEGIEGTVKLMSGRYGPYVTNGKVNATIPKGTDPEKITPEQAVELIKAKIEAGPSKKRPARRKRKA